MTPSALGLLTIQEVEGEAVAPEKATALLRGAPVRQPVGFRVQAPVPTLAEAEPATARRVTETTVVGDGPTVVTAVGLLMGDVRVGLDARRTKARA